jgi:hypothetical protein
MCFNHKVMIGLGVVALGVLALAPGAFLAALPVLLVLACPLSMVLMMRGMAGNNQHAEPDQAPAASSTDAEITRMWAEVDQLRAELRDRRSGARSGSRRSLAAGSSSTMDANSYIV